MKLGFVTAILPEYSLAEVFAFASKAGFSCLEVMCWPTGRVERRYAGVTHLDVTDPGSDALKIARDLVEQYGITISGLGYYPNPLTSDRAESEQAVAHLHRLIDASADLDINVVNSFIGRDPALSVNANWPRLLEVWRPLVKHAEERGVRIGIENCPMLFGDDEWPGGKNLATSPAIWRRMFEDLGSPSIGLNFDPSHLVWQQMDYLDPLVEFSDRLVHVHAKDARIDRGPLNDNGVLSSPKLWHTPKIPGQGDVRWGAFLGKLADVGYDGPVAIEVEDRAFEGSIEKRLESLVISRRYLLQYLGG